MLLIIALIASVWVLAMIVVWAMCAASAAGDESMGYKAPVEKLALRAMPEPQAAITAAVDAAARTAQVRFTG